jgi:hypothetical protein
LLEAVVASHLLLRIAATAVALLATAGAAAATPPRSCEWKDSGHDPYMGDVPAAVDRYADIPPATRARLKARMQRHAYDDIVAIRRDSIVGNFDYEPELRDMHFGKGRLCGQVTRQTWQPEREERGLAYCEDGQCIVVPLVCRNVSRILRKPAAATPQGPAPGAGDGPLVFDPPGAGMPPADLATPPPAELEPLPRTPLALPPAAPFEPATPPPLLSPPAPGAPDLPLPAPPLLPPLAPPPAVPEPAALLFWAAGLATLAAARRRCMAAAASRRGGGS